MEQVNFQELPKKEKKELLSMDLIERMIRVEQRVAASFGQYIPYNKTEYYRSLSGSERNKFEEYLKNKKNKKYIALIGFSSVFAIFIASKISFTGNAIKSIAGNSTLGIIQITSLAAGIGIIAAAFLLSSSKKKRMEKFESHYKVIDDILIRKKLTKR